MSLLYSPTNYTPDHPHNLSVQQFGNTIVLTWEKPIFMNGCELSG